MSNFISEEDFAIDFIASTLPRNKGTYVRTVGNTVEFADPDIGVYVITVGAAEVTACEA